MKQSAAAFLPSLMLFPVAGALVGAFSSPAHAKAGEGAYAAVQSAAAAKFDDALPFSDGLAGVQIDHKWGFIDRPAGWSSRRSSIGHGHFRRA